MSNPIEIQKNELSKNTVLQESNFSLDKNIFTEAPRLCQQAVSEAWDFTCQTAMHLDKRVKQADVVIHGILVGGYKESHNQLFNHTGATLAKVGITGAVGACLGAAMASKLQWVKLGTQGFGLLAGGTAIAATVTDLRSKPKLQKALSNVWHDDKNDNVIAAGKLLAETELAHEGFDIGLGMAGTAGGAIIGRFGSRIPGMLTRFAAAQEAKAEAQLLAHMESRMGWVPEEVAPFFKELALTLHRKKGEGEILTNVAEMESRGASFGFVISGKSGEYGQQRWFRAEFVGRPTQHAHALDNLEIAFGRKKNLPGPMTFDEFKTEPGSLQLSPPESLECFANKLAESSFRLTRVNKTSRSNLLPNDHRKVVELRFENEKRKGDGYINLEWLQD